MDGFCIQVDEGSHAAVPPSFAKAAETAGAAGTRPVRTANGAWDRFVNDGGTPEFVDPDGSAPVWDTETMQEIILAMPRKYRAVKNGLRFTQVTIPLMIVASNGTGYPNGWVPSVRLRRALPGWKRTGTSGPRATRV